MRSDARTDDGTGSEKAGRLLYVDLFRGVVMFLLVAEASGLYDLLVSPVLEGTVFHAIGLQFRHHPWHGLTVWDVGQPFFMFISGVAMALAYERRWERGETWKATLGRALRRSFLLFAAGWALSHINPVAGVGRAGFLLNILVQLSFAHLLAFLLLKRPAWVRAGAALGLIVLTELLYRFGPGAGLDPFSPVANFGAGLDRVLLGGTSEGVGVAFNIVPAAVHTLVGVSAGYLIRSGKSRRRKLGVLVAAGLAAVGAGLALDPLTPVVKQLYTSSFVILVGGLAILSLALALWLGEVVRAEKWFMPFAGMGLNPIFIYAFAQSGGGLWLRGIVEPFTMAFSRLIGDAAAQGLTCLAVLALFWGLCQWLYNRRIFIRA